VFGPYLIEFLDIRPQVDLLRSDEDLDGKVQGVQEALVAIFDSFAFLGAHQIEVNAFYHDDRTERAVAHYDDAVADFGYLQRVLGTIGVRFADRLGSLRRSPLHTGGLLLHLVLVMHLRVDELMRS
jgi:hypothetical protein